MIRLLEELSLNAWPALQTVLYDGWVLRFANGYTRRANSVQALYSSTFDLDEKIDYCETLYSARGQNTVFKLTGAEQPADLEAALVRRGYLADAHTSVQTCQLMGEAIEVSDSAAAEVQEQVSDDWLDSFCRLSRMDARHLPTMRMMLGSIVPKSGFFHLKEGTETVAVGLSVLERGFVGIYDIVIDADLRNRGLGTQVMRHILHWGQTNGAHTAYLQVMLNNPPALHLYQKLGFREIYRYWYRQKEK